MAIAYVSSAAHAGNPTTAPTVTLGATSANDIILFLCTNGGADAAPALSGTYDGGAWSLAASANGGASTDLFGGIWWSRATKNHTGQTIVATTTNSGAACAIWFSGCVTSGSPIHQATSGLLASGTNSLAGVTTTVDNCELVLGLHCDDNVASASESTTAPGALTERQDALSSGGADTACAVAHANKGAAGATGNFTWTNGRGAGIYLVANAIALAPYVAPTTVVKDVIAAGLIPWAR